MIIQFFLQDTPIVQVSLNITLSACVRVRQNLVYLAFFRPFGERALNISNFMSELAITLIFVFICVDLLDVPSSFGTYIDMVLVGLVNFIMAVQMLASVYVFSRTLGLILKQRCDGSKLVLPAPHTTNLETVVHLKKDIKVFS